MSRFPAAVGLSLSLLAGGLATASAQTRDGNAIIGRSARVYRSLTSLRADFVQVIENPMIDSSESRGTLMQAGDAKFAMRFSDPPGEAVVIDGARVWVYTPSTTPGQVLRMPLPSGGPVYGYNMLAWLLDRPTERYQTRFVRSERLNGRMADVVELVPHSADMPFDRATLWLDREDALPRRLDIQEKSGARRTLTLTKLRVNGRVSDTAFKFEVPSGVRIVDQ